MSLHHKKAVVALPVAASMLLLLHPLGLVSVSSVGAFLSSSPSWSSTRQQCQSSSSSSSLLAAFIDENGFPGPRQAPKTTTSTTTTTEKKKKTSHNNNATTLKKKKPPKILPNGGRITLVGAGPGDPDLLTIAAHKIITDPNNFIIVDRLVSNEILSLIEGEYRVANKNPGCQEIAQMEIFDWCRDGLREGRHVVRLKIGDPFVFGRGGEEVLEFREFGVEPTVIPGVSAAFSAPLLGSIPVTHRGVSNQVVMCTGYGKNNTSPDLIRYHKEQTVVFLMAVGRLRTLCHNLVTKAYYPVETPVAIVERAGCPDQRTVVGTMANIADLAEEYDVRPPSTIVVGDVVNVLHTEEDFGGEVECARQQGLMQSV